MLENINLEVSKWNWKNQTVWDEEKIPIWVILNRLETWYYQTKEVEIDLNTIALSKYDFAMDDLFEFMVHFKLVQNSDLKYPVIINKRWVIIDWRHRLCKAILEWKKKLKWIMVTDCDII